MIYDINRQLVIISIKSTMLAPLFVYLQIDVLVFKRYF